MKKLWMVIGILTLAAIAGGAVWFFVLRKPAAAPSGEAFSAVHVPDISLSINDDSEATVRPGAPLRFTVRVANQRAANAIAANAVLAEGEKPEPMALLQLPSGWQKFVRFEVQDGDGSRPAEWPLTLLGAPSNAPVRLDGQNTVEASWVLPPEVAGAVSTGTWQIVAVFETEPSRRSVSAPVTLRVNAEGENADLTSARYWARLKNWDKALEHARKAAAADAASIEAHSLAGDALAAKGDARGALAAYQAALRAFRAKHGDDPRLVPEYLLIRIRELRGSLLPDNIAPQGTKAPPPR